MARRGKYREGDDKMTTYKLVMPGDMNHYGFLFGGKMLMWVDEVAWIAVSEDYPTLHFVTVGMSEVAFKKSVHPQSVLRFDTRRSAEGGPPPPTMSMFIAVTSIPVTRNWSSPPISPSSVSIRPV